jgi:hypothetical protein
MIECAGFTEEESEAGFEMKAAGTGGTATTFKRGLGEAKVCLRSLFCKTYTRFFSSCEESVRALHGRSLFREYPLDSPLLTL